METYGVTARRVTKGGKVVVEISFPCGATVTKGGARADRATAVVVAAYGKYQDFNPAVHWNGDGSMPLHVVGLRGDAVAASREAARLLAPRPSRDKWGHVYPADRAASMAAAIPVEG
jgi:hypothetical protein